MRLCDRCGTEGAWPYQIKLVHSDNSGRNALEIDLCTGCEHETFKELNNFVDGQKRYNPAPPIPGPTDLSPTPAVTTDHWRDGPSG